MVKLRHGRGHPTSTSSVVVGSTLPVTDHREKDDDYGDHKKGEASRRRNVWQFYCLGWTRRWILVFGPPTLFVQFMAMVTILAILGYVGIILSQQSNLHQGFLFRYRRVPIRKLPRILKLGPHHIMHLPPPLHVDGDDVPQLALSNDITMASFLEHDFDHIPRLGSRQLNEKYNPLPKGRSEPLKSASTMDKGQCQQMHAWQSSQNPNCNVVHESTWGFDHPLGLNYQNVPDDFDYDEAKEDGTLFMDPNEQVRLGGGGSFRWVLMFREYDGTRRALKALRIDYGNDFDFRNTDRHRRDAVAFEQTTSSPLVVDIYGYCGNSALYDWGEGGDLYDIFDQEPDKSKEDLLKIAYNISMSIHDAHHFDDQGRATIAHTDIKPDQFLYQNGYYQLTDFNRARFLLWNHKQNKRCKFDIGRNGGIWRSPEEYAYEGETEKVDVYSLGNVLYYLLVQSEPWDGYKSKTVYKKVQEGIRPEIPEEFESSTEIFDRYMIKAMRKAWTHDMDERPGARGIAQILLKGIKEYEKRLRDT